MNSLLCLTLALAAGQVYSHVAVRSDNSLTRSEDGKWKMVYDEEFRHEEAINAAKLHYMGENQVDCDKLRANAFRLREEEDDGGEFNYWFVLEVIDPCNGRAPICSFKVSTANEVMKMDCHQLDRKIENRDFGKNACGWVFTEQSWFQ